MVGFADRNGRNGPGLTFSLSGVSPEGSAGPGWVVLAPVCNVVAVSKPSVQAEIIDFKAMISPAFPSVVESMAPRTVRIAESRAVGSLLDAVFIRAMSSPNVRGFAEEELVVGAGAGVGVGEGVGIGFVITGLVSVGAVDPTGVR